MFRGEHLESGPGGTKTSNRSRVTRHPSKATALGFDPGLNSFYHTLVHRHLGGEALWVRSYFVLFWSS